MAAADDAMLRKFFRAADQRFTAAEWLLANGAFRIEAMYLAGYTRISREKKVLPRLERLPEETQADIALVLLLTPAERQDSLMNLEFDDPTPSRL